MYPTNYRYLLVLTSQAPQIQYVPTGLIYICPNLFLLQCVLISSINDTIINLISQATRLNVMIPPTYVPYNQVPQANIGRSPHLPISTIIILVHSSLSTGIISSLDCFCSLLLLYLWQIFLWISISC